MRTSKASLVFACLAASSLAADKPPSLPVQGNAARTATPDSKASAQPAGEADPLRLAKPNAPGETLGGSPVDPKNYVIGPEDVLNVTVWRDAELSRPVIVRPDGKITLPLVNELMAAGLTPEELSHSIARGLERYVKEPQVNVSVQQVNSKKFFIQGEVNKPGPYPLVVPTTVLEALGSGGGFKDFANVKKIVILRGSERLKFNYKDVTHGKNLDQNILLQPGDQIIVP